MNRTISVTTPERGNNAECNDCNPAHRQSPILDRMAMLSQVSSAMALILYHANP
jgi:hypothetical protein